MCKAVYAVIWCSALGEVGHTSITYENEAIYVSFNFCYCSSCSPNDFMLLLLLLFSIYNYTWTTITNRATTKNNENKKTHINYRAYMP